MSAMTPLNLRVRWVAAILALASIGSPVPVLGCDLCGCYTPQVAAEPEASSGSLFGSPSPASTRFYAAIAEQFTHFGTLQFEGEEIANPTNQYEDSSITQLVAGCNVTSRCAVQINVPFIYRSFERPEGFEIDRGVESGLGDISILGRLVVFHLARGDRREVAFDTKSPRLIDHQEEFTASLIAIGGLKFPTGGTSRLKEEFEEDVIPGAPESGIHGHDLTLGTGSYDGLFGEQMSVRYRSFFFQADAQFALRGDGAHQYHFANDLSWDGGPGWYVMRRPNAVVGLQCACSGEHKKKDRFRGEPAEDTGLTAFYVGPRVIASFGKFSAELLAELPVSIENTALQVVPDYRLRAGIAFQF